MKRKGQVVRVLLVAYLLIGAGGVDASPLRVTKIWSGWASNCALISNGGLKCWGHAGLNALGYGDGQIRGDSPGTMGDRLPEVNLGQVASIDDVAIGNGDTCVRFKNGTAKCWGGNFFGSDAAPINHYIGFTPDAMGDALPFLNGSSDGEVIAEMSMVGHSSCFRFQGNKVKCVGTYVPFTLGEAPVVDFSTNKDVVEIDVLETTTSPAEQQMCARFDNGQVKCWGLNAAGVLGQGDTQPRRIVNGVAAAIPFVDLGDGEMATKLVNPWGSVCALLASQQVKCWGKNWSGSGVLGQGHSADVGHSPGQMGDALPYVNLGDSKKVVDIAAGALHVCALLHDGSVKCWGNNAWGQLGQGDRRPRGERSEDMGDRLRPIDFGGQEAIAISAGINHSCALFRNGGVRCWGQGTYGPLGQENSTDIGTDPSQMGENLPFIRLWD